MLLPTTIQIYGAKHLFGFSVIVPSILTMIVPVACKESYPFALFIRAILGFCESASFPCVFHFFPAWVPSEEKTIMISTVYSGMYIGEIIGFSLSGVLVDSEIMIGGQNIGGWPGVFYLFGAIGILWYPYWTYMAYETPEEHEYMTKEELLYIRQGRYCYGRYKIIVVIRNIRFKFYLLLVGGFSFHWKCFFRQLPANQ